MPGQTPRCPKQRLSLAELRASSRTPRLVACVFDSIVKRTAHRPAGNIRKSLVTLQNPCRNLFRRVRCAQGSPGYAARFFEALHTTPSREKKRPIQVLDRFMRSRDTMPRASSPSSCSKKSFARREPREPATDGYPDRGSGRSRASLRPDPGTPRAGARQSRPTRPPHAPCTRVRAYACNR